MRIFEKKIFVLLSVFSVVSLLACSATSKEPDFKYKTDKSIDMLIKNRDVSYPSSNFIVFSDPHILSPELGTGTVLEEYLSEDRKLLRESTKIMDALVDAVTEEQADFVIVTGDLTKDGERISHDLMAKYLKQIEATGKQVFIVPGNHDILNPHALRFAGDHSFPVATVTPRQFTEIYYDFGFGEAIYRDSNSLSYIVEPVPGLWLCALDSCRYKENPGKDEPVTDGRFSKETLDWLEGIFADAIQRHKAVMVSMHHGVTEHYKGQEKYFGEYIVDDYIEVSRLFAAYGARIVFTGHYHAQDITMVRFPGEDEFIFDIETGSLVTYPCPYRIIQIKPNQQLIVRSENITQIKGVNDFSRYARDYVEDGVITLAIKTLDSYGVKSAAAEKIAQQVGNGFLAHYAGDENLPSDQIALSSKGTGFMGWVVVLIRKAMITELWHDLYPPDNNVVVNLETGMID
jgi:predicted phosphodiesterase